MTLIHRVIARLNVGGPAMHVVNLTRSMDDGPWRTRLVAGRVTEDEGDMTYYARERGVEVTLVPELDRRIRPLADLRTLWVLWRLFRRERPQVVHTHTAKAGTLGRLAAVLAGVPVRVHTFHGHVLGGDYFSDARTRFFLEVERQLARLSSRLVVLTEVQAREMAEELAVAPREKFAVVPLGLELERFREVDRAALGAEVRRELGVGEGERLVGIVGRLVPIKNHELFLEAVAEARRRARMDAPPSPSGRPNSVSSDSGDAPEGPRHPPLRAVVVGAGEREAELKAYAARLGLDEEAVLWLGWRRDLPRLYAAFDAVALTSHDEGTPVALLEALAAGTPVVAREVGGVGEVLRGLGAGTLVPVEDGAQEWAQILRQAVDGRQAAPPVPGGPPLGGPPPAEARTTTPGWAQGLPDAIRDAVVRRYSVERLVADLSHLYEEELRRA